MRAFDWHLAIKTMNCFRYIKIALVTSTFAFCFGFASSCFRKSEPTLEIPDANSQIVSNQEVKNTIYTNYTKVPKGDELEVAIRVIKPQKAVLTILNKSADKVYLPYVPGERNDYAYIISYQLQIKDEKTGAWISYPPSDLGSDFNTLESREHIKGRIVSPKRGTFRINIPYLIDQRIYEKLNTISKIRNPKEYLKEFDKIEKEFDLSQKTITSIPFRL